MSTAVDFVRHFRQLRALVIGDAMLDTYLEGTAAGSVERDPFQLYARWESIVFQGVRPILPPTSARSMPRYSSLASLGKI
jgi:hypothetical protein